MRGIVLLTLITAGCGAKSTCVPGQSIACVCADGAGGAQVCKGDGSYAACQCGATANGGGDDMAGGGTGGNASGGGDMATGGGSSGAKRLFVTSSTYAGSVAASVCQTVADSVNLGGSWLPWLSASGQPQPDAIDRISGSGPWQLLDGTVAFANHAQLATSPSVPINMTELGQKLDGNSTTMGVWTGTLTSGVQSGWDCNHWTSTGYNGDTGSAATTDHWTADGSSAVSCASTYHVYCFEQ